MEGVGTLSVVVGEAVGYGRDLLLFDRVEIDAGEGKGADIIYEDEEEIVDAVTEEYVGAVEADE